MKQFFLRVEATNIENSLFNSSTLNTILSKSNLISDAIYSIPKEFSEVIYTISTGASVGVFIVEVKSISKVQSLKHELLAYLSENFNSISFSVSIVNRSDDYRKSYESLLSLNRWNQYQKPTLPLPKKNVDLRGKTEFRNSESNNQTVSHQNITVNINTHQKQHVSALIEHSQTLSNKQVSYEYDIELNKLTPEMFQNIEFANDVKQLTYLPNNGHGHRFGNLHSKMAIIYIDGNKFKKLLRDQLAAAVSGDNALSIHNQWDETIASKRAILLSSIINWIRNSGDPDWNYHEHDNCLRLIILLFTGDELMIATPAWKAWELLSFIFSKLSNWKFNGVQLTHAASIVFSNSNTPIHKTIQLARSLVDNVVKQGFDYSDKNLVAYEVLESFDVIGSDIVEYRNRRIHGYNVSSELCLDMELFDIHRLKKSFMILKRHTKKRLLHNYIYALYSSGINIDSENNLKQLNTMCLDLLADDDKRILKEHLGTGGIFWIHVLNLWDFIQTDNWWESKSL